MSVGDIILGIIGLIIVIVIIALGIAFFLALSPFIIGIIIAGFIIGLISVAIRKSKQNDYY